MSYAFTDMNNLPDNELLSIWQMNAKIRDNYLTDGERQTRKTATTAHTKGWPIRSTQNDYQARLSYT